MSETPHALNYRAQAKSLRKTAALSPTPDIRKDIEACARRLELLAKSIKKTTKSRD
jgi:hypothetical protein